MHLKPIFYFVGRRKREHRGSILLDGDRRGTMNTDPIMRWQGWLKTIVDEVTGLCHHQWMFDEIRELVLASPVAEMESSFFDYIIDGHVALATTAVRRQLGGGPDEISLVRLLKDIREHAHLLNAERHIELFEEMYPDDPHIGHAARESFRKIDGCSMMTQNTMTGIE